MDRRVHGDWSATARPTVSAVLFDRMCAAFNLQLPEKPEVAPVDHWLDHVITTTVQTSRGRRSSNAVPPGADRLFSKGKADQTLSQQALLVSGLRQMASPPGLQGKREHPCRGRLLLQSQLG